MKKIALILLDTNGIWTILLYSQPIHTTIFNYLYNLSYGLNFLLAALISLSLIPKHAFARTCLAFFAVSNLSFCTAQLVWIYYNLVAKTAVPYPGPADLFWLLFYPLAAIGFLLLLRLLKTSLTLGTFLEITATSSIVFLLISSFLSLNTSQTDLPTLTQILNYTYPIADSILIALSITTLRSQMGRLHSQLLYFILAFLALALGDTLFAYQTTMESYWNGNIADAIYALAGFLIVMGTSSLPQLLTVNSPSPQLTGQLAGQPLRRSQQYH